MENEREKSGKKGENSKEDLQTNVLELTEDESVNKEDCTCVDMEAKYVERFKEKIVNQGDNNKEDLKTNFIEITEEERVNN